MIPKAITEKHEALNTWDILSGYRGSVAHGTYIPSTDPDSIDDKDVMAVCVPPPSHYLGLAEFGSRGTREIMEGEWDIVVYEARKVMSLLRKANPNVLALLWMPESLYLNVTPAGQMLLDNRAMFSTKAAYPAFIGYARSNLVKMERGKYLGYMGEKRKELVDRFGYDCKSAAHAVRILRQGIEFLATGELEVVRHDAPELLAIKRGEWSLERVQSTTAKLLDRAEDALVHSTLPAKAGFEDTSNLCVGIVHEAWQERSLI